MKRKIFLTSLCAIALVLISNSSLLAQAIDITGKWNMKVEIADRSGTPVFVLKQAGELVTGTYTGQLGEAAVKGSIKDKDIKLEFKVGDVNVTYTGTVDGNTMKGKAAFGELGDGTFTGTKEAK